MSKKVAKVVLGLPLDRSFDYSVPEDLRKDIHVGQRVYVPFGKRKMTGIVVGFCAKSSFKTLRPIFSLLEDAPSLTENMLRFTKDFAKYYGCSWGQAIEASLPTALRKKKEISIKPDLPKKEKLCSQHIPVLCHDQGAAKRWPYIIERIKKTLSQGQEVLFLVPETAYLNRVENILKTHVDASVTILDKKLTLKNELENWLSAREGRSPIVVGTRSAVFAPLGSLGLIIIYEEENTAYKQDQSPFYHIREVVEMRAAVEECALLFVSSAPTAELWSRIRSQKIALETLSADQIGAMQMIDLSNYKPRRRSSVSFPLQNALQGTLVQKGKSVLLLNRRGFSTSTVCNACGHIVKCERCDVRLSYLYSQKKLVCSRCNFEKDLPKACPHCHSPYIRSTGAGIEKVESEIARMFPQAIVGRFDKDSDSFPEDADIVIATQAVLKELDHVRVDMIGVLDIDAELSRFDFRSAQKVFSLLVRLRQAARDKVWIQTYQIDNYCIKHAMQLDFDKFYKKELKLRKECGFPPSKHIISVVFRGPKEEVVLEQSKAFHERLQEYNKKGKIDILDPQPDIVSKLRDQYRFNIVLKGRSVERMHALIKKATGAIRKRTKVIETVNVDP